MAQPFNNPSGLVFGGYRGAGDLLRVNAEVLGRQTGVIFGDLRLSWKEVNARANRFANHVHRLGIRRGDRVALFARNSNQWVEALFGLAKVGAVAVTVNYRLTAPEVEYILRNAGARAIVCGATESETARGVATNVSDVSWLIGVNGASGNGMEDFEAMIAQGDEREPHLDRPLGFDEPAMLLYTSGTTGFPKGAIYTHGSLLAGMFVHVHAIGSRCTHRVMLASPLYSAAGIAGIYCAVMVGSQIALINFELALALETMKLLKWDDKTHAMSFLYCMTPGFEQDNISYHDVAEECYHIWSDSWMMQFGRLPNHIPYDFEFPSDREHVHLDDDGKPFRHKHR